MDDIEVVVKIDKSTYYRFIDGFADEDDSVLIENLFKNAMPLPKGHGRLIDADELKKTIQENDVLNMTGFNVRLCDINNTPTIIEADKGEE